MKDFLEKVTDILFNIWEKIEKLADNISEKTGIKINAPMVVGVAFLIVFAIIIVKSVLGWVASSL